jgi:hypothetical protein
VKSNPSVLNTTTLLAALPPPNQSTGAKPLYLSIINLVTALQVAFPGFSITTKSGYPSIVGTGQVSFLERWLMTLET